MEVKEDNEQGINYNKYETSKNLRDNQNQENIIESIEEMNPSIQNNINFND
jgi:hypothetical protein